MMYRLMLKDGFAGSKNVSLNKKIMASLIATPTSTGTSQAFMNSLLNDESIASPFVPDDLVGNITSNEHITGEASMDDLSRLSKMEVIVDAIVAAASQPNQQKNVIDLPSHSA